MTDPVLEKEVVRARSASEADLHLWAGLNPSSPLRAAATVELERRAFWRAFWSHGIISWVALVVSILSLLVSAYVAFSRHSG